MRATLTSIALLLMLSVSAFAQINPVPPMMQFQGRLTRPDGTPVPDGNYSVRFSLHTALTGGTEKWNQTINPVMVRQGTFSVALNTSTGAADKWQGSLFLEIKIGTDAPLSPRQPLASVAYAMKADSVKDNAITSASIANGSITASDLAPNTLNPLAWLLGGNANPSSSAFLGTTTNHPLTLKVNNRRVMEYTYMEDVTDPNPQFQHRAVNVLGGADINSIAPGMRGATIVGGGDDYFEGFDNPNTVTNHFGTIVGGSLNTADGFAFVGGGYNNAATEFYATIVGGTFNEATNNQTFIGGGINNTASGFGATVPGGSSNVASNNFATVGGGQANLASGSHATVPGGANNTAAGDFSLAAGRRAKANHAGSFVWGDSTNADFASTAANQFLIRAAGGVGINTTSLAGYTLFVNGSIRATSLNLSGSQSTAGSSAVTGNHTVGGNLNVGGTLRIGNVPFGDYRNVQIHGTTGQIYYDNSSRKHKENITPLQDDFEKLLQAVPMTYTRPNAPGRWEIGFIAEDFDELGLKRLVDYGEKGEVEGINYEKICLYLTAIARKQRDTLTQQQKQIEELKERNARSGKVEAENAELKATLNAVLERLERLERLEAERK